MVRFRTRRGRHGGGISPVYATVRRRIETRTKEERRTAAITGFERKQALAVDMKTELVRQLDVIEDLANKHAVQQDKVRKLLMHFRRKRTNGVNTWNVHLNATARQINSRKSFFSYQLPSFF